MTGSQLLLGYPQYVWFSLLAEGAYAGFVLTAHRYTPRSGCDLCITCSDCVGCTTTMWPQLIIAKGIGLLIGGVQLLPTIDALSNSSRQSSDSAFALWGSLHPLNLLQLVAPYLFTGRVVGDNGHEFSVYVGAVPLMLVVWLAMRHRNAVRLLPLIVATAGFGLAALVLALGYYGGLYRLVAWLPLLNLFRFPCRYLLLFQLAVTVLASIGLLLLLRESQQAQLRRGTPQPVERRSRRIAWRNFGPLWMTVGVSAAVAVVGIKLRSEPYIASIPAILIGPVLMGMAATLVAIAARGFPAALIGLVLLAVADQGWYGLSYSVYSSSAGLDEFAASANTPPSEGDGRVLSTLLRSDQPGLRIGDRMTLDGWRRADGYAGLEPKQKLDYYHVVSLRVAGVRWVQQTPSTKDIPGLTAHDAQWREVPAPLPRVRLVNETRGSLDPGNDLHRISPDRVALTDYTLVLPPSTPGSVALTHDRPGRLEIDVETAAPQMLVIAESFHPGWQAAVDAQPRDLFRVDGDFMGCMVGPGKEHVVLSFRPASLQRGWLASILGLSMIALCFVGSRTATPPAFLKDLMS